MIAEVFCGPATPGVEFCDSPAFQYKKGVWKSDAICGTYHFSVRRLTHLPKPPEINPVDAKLPFDRSAQPGKAHVAADGVVVETAARSGR